MSRLLRVAFCGEGNRDIRVVPIAIHKIIAAATPRIAFDYRVDAQLWDTRQRFDDALVSVVRGAQVSAEVVVVHVDADGPDQRRVRQHKVEPGSAALTHAGLDTAPLTWAIPIQAIEAWLLVSAEAFAEAVTGQRERARELDFPRNPEMLHRDAAKQLFDESVYQLLARTQRQRRRIHPGSFSEVVIETMSLADLRRAMAFAQFEQELRGMLARLGYIE
ncbi:MAG: DUF4276 family protein [Chloroflexales bacterium]|nr:DUF4276 family protein [Chloroflexales bacterium]